MVEEISVFSLINKLCWKFSNKSTNIKKLRSLCYEILLKKSAPNYQDEVLKYFNDVDPYSNLLAWQYVLINNYGLNEHAKELRDCADNLKKLYNNDEKFNNILKFLLHLRQLPKVKVDPFDPDLESYPIPRQISNNSSVIEIYKQKSFININDETKDEESVWDIVLNSSPLNQSRTWENFGLPDPDRELPLLSELDEDSHLYVESLPSLYFNNILKHIKYKPSVKPMDDFLNDIKKLMVGLASDSFIYGENGDFILVENLTVKGISIQNLESFCNEFIRCGNCFKALNKFTNSNLVTCQYQHTSYIFTEFCKKIQKYLDLFRQTVFYINTHCLLRFASDTEKLKSQIFMLTSICKLGPYEEDFQMPHGVALLNYLYLNLLNIFDKNIILVLYSILLSCCQVYFSRFLQQWILDGFINDPHNEFFIKTNSKYINKRARDYWTNSFIIAEDVVPDFLIDLKDQILKCGRSMNLLKLCCRSNKLCLLLMGEKPPIISCCITPKQLKNLEYNTTTYYLNVNRETGKKFNILDYFNKDIVDPHFLELIEMKRTATLKRINLENQKLLKQEREKKLEQMKILKDQYDMVLERKQLNKAIELKREIDYHNNCMEQDQLRNKLIKEEAVYLTEQYEKLNETAEIRRRKIEDRNKQIRNIHLNLLNNDDESEIEAIPDEGGTFKVTETQLTEAQRNKLKVLSSEFGDGFVLDSNEFVPIKKSTISEINRMKNMKSSDCFYYDTIIDGGGDDRTTRLSMKNSKSLTLDIRKPVDEDNIPLIINDNNFLTPMSVDSTPLSEHFNDVNSEISTGQPPINEDGFNFDLNDSTGNDSDNTTILLPIKSNCDDLYQNLSMDEDLNLNNLNKNCLKLFLNQSISIPLMIQTKLVNNELLKYFINDLKYLDHLISLRDYFFLQNGEFGRKITTILFEQLYSIKYLNPKELINCPNLHKILEYSLYSLHKVEDNSNFLSFNINYFPDTFDLTDPNVFDCLSLTYKIEWPLNILIPIDVIIKYNEVFKFLLKLSRMIWLHKQIVFNMKQLAKQTGHKELYLMMSPHYQKIQQYRYIMFHFLNTLQNYIIGEILQPSWRKFEMKVEKITNLDELYRVHTYYLKEILFLCLLNKKSEPLRKIIEKIFNIILKFYEYLCARPWTCQEGHYVHPNFNRLQTIFRNFEQFVLFLFHKGRKAVQYQPQLAIFFDMLDINGYYSNKKTNS